MEIPKIVWVGFVKPMHSTLFAISHECIVRVFSSHFTLTWEGINGENMRSFRATEVLGVELQGNLQNQYISVFILKADKSFKHYRLDSMEGGTHDDRKSRITELFQNIECICQPKQKMKLLFIINPLSGKGEATNIMRRITPIFSAAGIEVAQTVTAHRGHAKEIMRTADISKYKGFVCVSGDGTINEAISGLLENRLYSHSMDPPFPLGVIPAGTPMRIRRSTHPDMITVLGRHGWCTCQVHHFAESRAGRGGDCQVRAERSVTGRGPWCRTCFIWPITHILLRGAVS
jgi:hypothetical protein